VVVVATSVVAVTEGVAEVDGLDVDVDALET